MADAKGSSNKKLQPIIIKRKKVMGHGHHGGSWKVAFADFMTAMMAFFLVMWLLGSDDETKAAVSNYFKNPSSAFRIESDKAMPPPGDKTGQGENVLNGADGALPDDLIEKPSRAFVVDAQAGREAGEVLEALMYERLYVDLVQFSIPEEALFEPGSQNKWSKSGHQLMNKVGKLLQKYRGDLEIRAAYPNSDAYDSQLNRAVSVGRYVTDNRWAPEERVKTGVVDRKRMPASAAVPNAETPRIQFTLSRVRS